jgi:hypothetical protein
VAELWVGGAVVWLIWVSLVVCGGGLLVGGVAVCFALGGVLVRCGCRSWLGRCEGALSEGGWWRRQWGWACRGQASVGVG